MKKVLVAVDGSDKSLEAADYAMSIANKEHAQLIILNVLDTEPWFYGQSAYGWATEDVPEKGLRSSDTCGMAPDIVSFSSSLPHQEK